MHLSLVFGIKQSWPHTVWLQTHVWASAVRAQWNPSSVCNDKLLLTGGQQPVKKKNYWRDLQLLLSEPANALCGVGPSWTAAQPHVRAEIQSTIPCHKKNLAFYWRGLFKSVTWCWITCDFENTHISFVSFQEVEKGLAWCLPVF